MAVTFVGKTAQLTNANPATAAAISGLQVGDLLLAFVSANSAPSSLNPPSGWVAVTGKVTSGTNPTTQAFAKTATVGDVGSGFAFSRTGGSGYLLIYVYAFRGATQARGLGATFPSSNAVTPSLTISGGSAIVDFWAWGGNIGFFPASGTPALTVLDDGGSNSIVSALSAWNANPGAGTYQGKANPSPAAGGVACTVELASNRPPNAPAWTTADGQTVDVAADSVLSWTFSDPDPGDSQSQYVLDRWALDSGGARAGAAVRTTVSTPVTSYTIPGGSLVAGTQYEFKVATRDAQGLPTLDADLLFSTSLFQTFKAKPSAPTITAPAAGATVNATGTLTWSTPNQDAYQVQQLDGSGVLVPGTDTGEVGGDAGITTRSLTLSFPTNNVPRTLQVRRRYGGLWSVWATVAVTVSWTPPADPTAVKASVPADAAIDLTITNPAPSGGEPTVAYNSVYLSAAGVPEYRAATLVAPNSTWRFWTPQSGLDYTFRVLSVASNGTTSETTVS